MKYFFYFLKNIFDISVSKRYKNIKKKQLIWSKEKNKKLIFLKTIFKIQKQTTFMRLSTSLTLFCTAPGDQDDAITPSTTERTNLYCNHLGGGPVVRVWNQEICFLCGLRFEPCGCSYDGH